MSNNDDRMFMRQFTGVIIGFIVLTIALLFLARSMQYKPDENINPSQRILLKQRIEPVAGVRVGAEGAAALAEQQTVAAAPDPADIATVDGKEVYSGLCQTCHDAGVAGAPIKGSDDMRARLEERGLEQLVTNAINGYNAMPPRGGNPTLTDEQMRAAVEHMLP
ncbi:MAG: c-type cytochrome [Xanthomonadales bacterium]|nr:c-type cytochrome [Xanthomonadales bacterium]